MAKIFFAGAEKYSVIKDLIEYGVENVLFSYFYILKRQGEWPKIRELLDKYPKTNVFLDSGAFTFLNDQSKSLPPPEKYFDTYLKFVDENKRYFEYVCELDIDYIWSQEILDKRREELFSTGANIVVSWHRERGMDRWRDYLDDPRIKHLAMGSDTNDDHWQQARMVNMALAAGKGTHGFAMTKLQTTLKYVKFATVDSTTWTSGERYGDIYIFEHNKWTLIGSQSKHERRKHVQYWKKIGCDPTKIIEDDPKEVRKANIIAWSRMSKRVEIIHKHRRTKEVYDRETGEVLDNDTNTREVGVEGMAKNVIVKDGRIYIKKNTFRGVSDGDLANTVSKMAAPATETPPAPLPVPQPVVSAQPALPDSAPLLNRDGSIAAPFKYEEQGFGFLPVMPKFSCSTCSLSADCPKYQEGYVCYFTDKFSGFKTRNMDEIREIMRRIVQQNTLRLQRGYMMEELVTGGQLDKEVTSLSNTVIAQAKDLAALESSSGSVKLEATGKGVSVLAQLFARPKSVDEHKDEVIDVSSEPKKVNDTSSDSTL